MGSLPEIFKKVISFLEKEKIDYLVIGGVAMSVQVFPRMTQDVDVCVSIKKKDVKGFLRKAGEYGFTFDEKKALKSVKETGTFKVSRNGLRVDFIILSTDFEKTALSRGQRLEIFGTKALFPTPEDLILLKVVPHRAIDVADIENIAKKFQGKLDKEYLISWAQKLSDEAENLKIYKEVKRVLGK